MLGFRFAPVARIATRETREPPNHTRPWRTAFMLIRNAKHICSRTRSYLSSFTKHPSAGVNIAVLSLCNESKAPSGATQESTQIVAFEEFPAKNSDWSKWETKTQFEGSVSANTGKKSRRDAVAIALFAFAFFAERSELNLVLEYLSPRDTTLSTAPIYALYDTVSTADPGAHMT